MGYETRKLRRSVTDRKIAGVCAGLAEYFGVDVTIVRLLFLLLVISPANGILIYIVLWLLMPQERW